MVVRKNLDCREICAVAAVVEYQQAAESMKWVLAEGSRLPFPSVLEGGKKGELALTPAQVTTNLQTHLRAAGVECNRYTMQAFRVGRSASDNMDGWHGHGYFDGVRGVDTRNCNTQICRVTASAASAEMKRSRETASIEAEALPLSEQFPSSLCVHIRRSYSIRLP